MQLHILNTMLRFVSLPEPSLDVSTVFVLIIAAATINFSLAGVQLLIKGGSYSKADFIKFGVIPLDAIDSFIRTNFQIFEIYD